VTAQKELAYQSSEKADRASELVVAQKELAYQSSEKADRASELITANIELIYQIGEKNRRAAEFVILSESMDLQNERIENLTYRDQLTGLYNRDHFKTSLVSSDVLENLPISLVIGDINGLSLISQWLDQETADQILVKFTQVLRSVARKNDTIFRLANGEFALILPNTTAEQAQRFVKRLKAKASQETVGTFAISISCGVQTKADPTIDLNESLRFAVDELTHNKRIESATIEIDSLDLIMKMLFEKNAREMMHCSRVSEISESLARCLQFDHAMIDRARVTGMLHDIGKIGIDEKILNHDGVLNELEWHEVKKHPEIGYRILSLSSTFASYAEDVNEHHERHDGKGYPKGLLGDKITPIAKIISIADTYDALTSNRAYRQALSEEAALKEINRCSGSQFDPEMTEAFIRMMKETA
jgi:diguanylate cyclase (GGDEF)-like protein